MKRFVLLINTSDGTTPLVYPIGLDYLKSSLSQTGLEVVCLDLALYDPSSHETLLCNILSQHNWDVVGFNLRNVCDQTDREIRYIPALKKLIGTTRVVSESKRYNPIVVIGGTGAALATSIVMQEVCADVVIAGDGEAGFKELLDNIGGSRLNNTVIRALTDISSISFTRGLWGHVEEYLRLGADGNLQTKRGCAKNCTYCAYPVIEGRQVRLRDPKLAAKEFLDLERLGFKKIFIVDTVFNDPLPHAKQVLKELRAADTHAEWTGFFNPKYIDIELLELVRATNGGHPLKLAIENGSDAILDALKKGFCRKDIVTAASLCRSAKVPFSLTVLFGGPGENTATIAETCSLIRELKPAYVSASIGIYIYPQTPLARQTHNSLWTRETELLGDTVYPVDRATVRGQVESLLAGSPFSVYIH